MTAALARAFIAAAPDTAHGVFSRAGVSPWARVPPDPHPGALEKRLLKSARTVMAILANPPKSYGWQIKRRRNICSIHIHGPIRSPNGSQVRTHLSARFHRNHIAVESWRLSRPKPALKAH